MEPSTEIIDPEKKKQEFEDLLQKQGINIPISN